MEIHNDLPMLGYGILWIESAAAAVLLVASLTAFAAHWTRWRGQHYVPLVHSLAAAALASVATQWIAWLKYQGKVEHPWVPYTVSWTVAFSIASGLVLVLGLKLSSLDRGPAAANWSRLRLALGTGAALILLGATVNSMDAAVSMQNATVQTEANARFVQLLGPAVAERENAAPVYRQAAEALPTDESPEFWEELLANDKPVGWRFIDTQTFNAKDPRLAEYVKNRAAAISFFREACWKNECRFDRDFSNGWGTLLPELTLLGQGSGLLAWDGLNNAANNQFEVAEEDHSSHFADATPPFGTASRFHRLCDENGKNRRHLDGAHVSVAKAA